VVDWKEEVWVGGVFEGGVCYCMGKWGLDGGKAMLVFERMNGIERSICMMLVRLVLGACP